MPAVNKLARPHKHIGDGNLERALPIVELVVDSAQQKVIGNEDINMIENDARAQITNASIIREIYRIISEMPQAEEEKK